MDILRRQLRKQEPRSRCGRLRLPSSPRVRKALSPDARAHIKLRPPTLKVAAALRLAVADLVFVQAVHQPTTVPHAGRMLLHAQEQLFRTIGARSLCFLMRLCHPSAKPIDCLG